MVTVELAVAIPVLVFVLGLALVGLRAGIDQIRCVDAARAGARVAARGESIEAARSAALAAAPERASVQVSVQGRRVEVLVDGRVGGSLLPTWSIHASAVADLEMGDGETTP